MTFPSLHGVVGIDLDGELVHDVGRVRRLRVLTLNRLFFSKQNAGLAGNGSSEFFVTRVRLTSFYMLSLKKMSFVVFLLRSVSFGGVAGHVFLFS